jgi:hypothetical protein
VPIIDLRNWKLAVGRIPLEYLKGHCANLPKY